MNRLYKTDGKVVKSRFLKIRIVNSEFCFASKVNFYNQTISNLLRIDKQAN